MSTRTKVADKSIDDNGVTITFTNGSSLVASLADLTPEIVTQLALHGLSQKIGDAYAGVSGDVDQAVQLAQAVYENLKNGRFKAVREGGGGVSRATDLAKALARVAGVELSEAIAKLEEIGKEGRAELKKNEAIEDALLDIQREKLEAKKAALAETAGDKLEQAKALFG